VQLQRDASERERENYEVGEYLRKDLADRKRELAELRDAKQEVLQLIGNIQFTTCFAGCEVKEEGISLCVTFTCLGRKLKLYVFVAATGRSYGGTEAAGGHAAKCSRASRGWQPRSRGGDRAATSHPGRIATLMPACTVTSPS
jgi:hypothetical protein